MFQDISNDLTRELWVLLVWERGKEDTNVNSSKAMCYQKQRSCVRASMVCLQ